MPNANLTAVETGRGQDATSVRADVLVIGGGPSAAWAAYAAAEAGASVVLVDKGYVGTSGATAPSNTGTWCVPPGDARRTAVDRRFERTFGIADQRWMHRAVDTCYANLIRLSEWGYPFPREEDGRLYLANLRGPDYMRFMRRHILRAGVKVLDHHPALELLSDGDGVRGAAGIARQLDSSWRVSANAVVMASGGCAFGERILGGTGATGDGYLMAAEAGAVFSGMEFTGKYTLAPYGTSLNKGLPYRWGTFFHEDGTPLLRPDGAPVGGLGADADVAKALLEGPVYAQLDQAEPEVQRWLRDGQPNVFLPFDRMGIDPFGHKFRVTLRGEGTIRGVGGIRLADDHCWTGVPGLFAAGDAASRENMTGAISGGGSYNASWAIASGYWAGRGAAGQALRTSKRGIARELYPLGRVGLRPTSGARPAFDMPAVVQTVRAEMVPLDRNFFRTGATLEAARASLDDAWTQVAAHLGGAGTSAQRSRETVSMLATARWIVAAASARQESRGLHRRLDRPGQNANFLRRIAVSGLDHVAVEAEPTLQEAAAS